MLKLRPDFPRFMLACAGLIFVMLELLLIWLATWQWERHQQALMLEANLSLELAAPIITNATQLTTEYVGRRALVTGEWQGTGTVYLLGQKFENRPAVRVLTPLRLDSGEVVIIDRGLFEHPRQAALPTVSQVKPALSQQSLSGVIHRWPGLQGWLEGPATNTDPRGLLRLDQAAVEKVAGEQIIDVWLQTGDATHPAITPRPTPPLAERPPHLYYFITWTTLAVIMPLLAIFWFSAQLRGGGLRELQRVSPPQRRRRK